MNIQTNVKVFKKKLLVIVDLLNVQVYMALFTLLCATQIFVFN